jgi:hypothetical protein
MIRSVNGAVVGSGKTRMIEEDLAQNEIIKDLFGSQRFRLIVAGAWLQLMIATFVTVQFERVQTPVSSWLTRILHLVGL